LREIRLWAEALSDRSVGQSLACEQGESHHFAQVLRGKVGDAVILMDGKGREAKAVCSSPHRKKSEFIIEQMKTFAQGPRLELIGPIPKGKRFPYLCEKIQELGVSRYSPLATEHSVREETSCSGKDKVIERFREACKQSRNPWQTELGDTVMFDDVDWNASCFVLDVGGMSMWSLTSENRPSHAQPLKLFFGPEAGWSDRERQVFIDQGVTRLGVAAHHLRMESAAVVGSGMLLDYLLYHGEEA
jgi:16S rRNA (uracil1498-N3)-methyltransferase